MTLRFLAASALVLWATASPALAESFRCPSTERYVEVGDVAAEVLAKCGPPAAKEVIKGGKARSIAYERWVYDFGDTYLTRILLFQSGRLIRIDEGGYGRAR
jgi:hypothetical protein